MLKHGYNRTNTVGPRPEYLCWQGMLTRCYNSKDKGYHRYGGRGIVVDPSWHSFENFIRDMGDRPSSNHWLERIDNNGPYSAQNCRWATAKEQANNRRNNRVLDFQGLCLTISQWADRLNVSRKLIGNRLQIGWLVPEALTIPKGGRRNDY